MTAAKRHNKNPIITVKDIAPSAAGMQVIGVFNAGVARLNGKTLLLLRVAERAVSSGGSAGVPMYEETQSRIEIKYFDRSDKTIDFSDPRFIKTQEQLYLTSVSHLRLAVSEDNINFEIAGQPFMSASDTYEEFGIEDPRITFIDGFYYITYSAVSRMGIVTRLARTKDFESAERLGTIFLADNKDVAIFPQKINGKYYVLHRPVSAYFNKPEIWISESDDLKAFYNHRRLCALRTGHFDCERMGASCVPFLTDEGWLEIYHGCDKNNRYVLSGLLLDRDDPSKVLARGKTPIFEPEAQYETSGFMPNVVFSCGAYNDGDIVHLYYGACDESVCYATFSAKEILMLLK